MPTVRLAQPDDLDMFYEIALVTGDAGEDARDLYHFPKLLGEIYAVPYLALTPDTCLVIEDKAGVMGYAVGALSTPEFSDHLERNWWPNLRGKNAMPSLDNKKNWSEDEKRINGIYFPTPTPMDVVGPFPAHLHLNLHPRAQGQSLGASLCFAWLSLAKDKAASGVHVGVNARNERGLKFWKKCGFAPIELNPRQASPGTVWLGRSLESI